MQDKTAVVIPNYNMPERTDALVEYLMEHAKAPHDIYVVDNGSDIMPPSQYTNVFIEENCQTTCGWLTGMRAADTVPTTTCRSALTRWWNILRSTLRLPTTCGWLTGMRAADTVEKHHGKSYLAYLIMITSTEFVEESGDPLTPLVEFLVANPNAAVVHAALTEDSTSALGQQMKDRGSGKPRRTYLIDNIAALWRADWLNSIGRFRPELRMGWGVLRETCWMARRDRKTIWIHEGTCVKKVSNIGYKMKRMNMTAIRRGELADAEAKLILEPIYGPDFKEKLGHEWTRPTRNGWECDY